MCSMPKAFCDTVIICNKNLHSNNDIPVFLPIPPNHEAFAMTDSKMIFYLFSIRTNKFTQNIDPDHVLVQMYLTTVQSIVL